MWPAVICVGRGKTATVTASLELCVAIGHVQRIQIEGFEVHLSTQQGVKGHRDGEAPVAEVVLSMNRPPDPFEEPGHGVTDDRGSEVADMHLFGDVDPADIDGHAVRLNLGFDAEPFVVHAHQGHGEGVGFETEVEKTRPCNLRFRDHAFETERGRHQGGGEIHSHLPRLSAKFLGQGHRRVQLKVAKLGLGTGLEGGIDTGRGIATDRFNSGNGGGFDLGHGILDSVHRTEDSGRRVRGVPFLEFRGIGSAAGTDRPLAQHDADVAPRHASVPGEIRVARIFAAPFSQKETEISAIHHAVAVEVRRRSGRGDQFSPDPRGKELRAFDIRVSAIEEKIGVPLIPFTDLVSNDAVEIDHRGITAREGSKSSGIVLEEGVHPRGVGGDEQEFNGRQGRILEPRQFVNLTVTNQNFTHVLDGPFRKIRIDAAVVGADPDHHMRRFMSQKVAAEGFIAVRAWIDGRGVDDRHVGMAEGIPMVLGSPATLADVGQSEALFETLIGNHRSTESDLFVGAERALAVAI